MSDIIEVQETPEVLDLAERRLAIIEKAFKLSQREANLLATSDFAPKAFKGNIANCVIAMNLARRFNMEPALVMQNVAIIHGKPSWEAKFLIALINQSRQFTRLHYCYEGKPNDDSWGCHVETQDRATGAELVGPSVTIAMAKADGWYHKDGSKWKSMPQMMLMYRAATFFARIYCPELVLGMQSHDEVIDSEPVAAAAPRSLGDLIGEN